MLRLILCLFIAFPAFSYVPCHQTPGLADAYVLALSLQPAFCETYGYDAGKPECFELSASQPQARHFSLHGLWPNQARCGTRYGFCETASKRRHCDYSPLNLSDSVAGELKQLMPSYAYGSCLERHEWYKHGSCQILSADEYFTLAIRLTKEANQTEFAKLIQSHRGKKLDKAQLKTVIEQTFGEGSAPKVYLGCKQGMLVDVFIQLPALIPRDASLSDLVLQASEYACSDRCPNQIEISEFESEIVQPASI